MEVEWKRRKLLNRNEMKNEKVENYQIEMKWKIQWFMEIQWCRNVLRWSNNIEIIEKLVENTME